MKIEDEIELWRKIGEMNAYANPDGYMATKGGKSCEERLAEIWNVLQSLEPKS